MAVLLAAGAALALGPGAAPSPGQQRVELAIDSGLVSAGPADRRAEPRAVFSTVVRAPDARWIQLRFGEVQLGGRTARGDQAYLEIRSALDGGTQLLRAEHLDQWQYASAYFNGEAVEVRLYAYPGAGDCRVVIAQALVGVAGGGRGDEGEGGIASICGPADDRVLSADPRIGRGWTNTGLPRCTTWIFNDCNRCLMTAGHCRAQQLVQVHFNIPLSDPNGNENHPPPEFQYAIDPASWNFLNAGLGNDWAHFGCFPNPNTGLTPFEAAGAFVGLTLEPPAPTGQPIRVTGYGTIEPPAPPPPLTWNRVLSTHVGPYTSLANGVVGYAVDTTGGNSGSPVLLEGSGTAIGIHTHAACDAQGGQNLGTALSNSFFRESLATPKGVCVPELTVTQPRAGRVYYGSAPQAIERLWPVPLGFAIVANRAQLDLEASDGRSYVSAVDFAVDGLTCIDATPLGDLFRCALAPAGGYRAIVARAFNPWGDPVREVNSDVAFYKTGDSSEACWLAGTMIRMADLSERPIESLAVGDFVQVYSLLNGDVTLARVTKTYAHTPQEMGDHFLVINQTWRVTPNHLLWARPGGVGVGRLMRAGQLKAGDRLVGPGGANINIVQIQQVFQQVETYNFEIGATTRVCTPYYGYVAHGAVAYPLKEQLVSMVAPLLYGYGLLDLGTLGASDHLAHAINNTGLVAGTSGGRAFRWTYEGGLVNLAPGAAYAVNAGNIVVGVSNNRATVWHPVDGQLDLGAGAAYGINDAGVVVGTNGTQAVKWQGGQPTILGPGIAYGINAGGDVVGQSSGRATVWPAAGGTIDIGPGSAFATNDAGQVVGQVSGQAFVWQGGNTTLITAGAARDINASGLVVGETAGQAFVWEPAGGLRLVSAGVWPWSQWTPAAARAINDTGYIVGNGTLAGVPRAFQAVPTGLAFDVNGNGVPDLCEVGGSDCNNNGIPDEQDIAQGFSQDCNGNLIPDECDIAYGISGDCNSNGIPDDCDIAQGLESDCNGNGVPDQCDVDQGLGADCNNNGLLDECDIKNGLEQDCNANSVPDSCDLAAGTSKDCNGNGVPDECDIDGGFAQDCNGNGIPDSCDLAAGTSKDCNGNGIPDECDIAGGFAQDCNANGVPDSCDLAAGASQDCNGNGIPDECDIAGGFAQDCNGNGVPDSCDLANGTSTDCNTNGVPDECDLLGGQGADCNNNGILDECDILNGTAQDCNANGVPDSCDIADGTAQDCNTNGVPDSCDIANGTAQDCNGNGVPDSCDIANGTAQDCNTNGIPDSCDIANGTAQDCNGNNVPDSCDIANGTAQDCNGNNVPDSCDIANGTAQDCNANGVPDSCDIANGTAQDCNANGVPDSCDIASGSSTDLNNDGVPDDCQDCNGNAIPDDMDIANGTSQDVDGNGLPDECQLPDAPSNPLPPDGATNVGLDPVLSVLVTSDYDGPVDVRIYGIGSELTHAVDTESQWQQGVFDATVTDGAGRLLLGENVFEYGDGSDGDLVVSLGTFNLPAGKQYQNVTVLPDGVLNTQGHTLRVKGLLLNYGTIADLASGGAGGAGYLGGRGQDPKQNDNPPGPLTAQPGACGDAGLPGAPGAGHGGAAGGSGGGGGGAQRNIGTSDADGGWNHLGPAERRGSGGAGGRGGGVVRIFAFSVQHYGSINANGANGQDGQRGGDGQYFAGGGIDLAGGGGGGGAGGNGGGGGLVELRYAQLVQNTGLIEAKGGAGGAGGQGGIGRNVITGVADGAFFQGAAGACGGGNGGRGEYRGGFASTPGTAGAPGQQGQNGSVSVQQLIPGYSSIGRYYSAWLCTGEGANWVAGQVVASTPPATSVAIAYSADGQTWYNDIQAVPMSSCLRFRLTLTTSNPQATPTVDRVVITYKPHLLLASHADVPSGTRASAAWAGLLPDRPYCWYAVADDVGGSAASAVWCFETGDGSACPGDLNHDGLRNQSDLGILLADYGCNAGPGACPGDIDGDGRTDQSDLGVLLALYGVSCP